MGHPFALQAAAGLQKPLHHRALHTAADSIGHHMLHTAVSSSADLRLPVSCRPRQAQRQERLRHHALQIADEDFTVRHVDSPLQGQACFSGFDYTLNPYQVGLLGCFTLLG